MFDEGASWWWPVNFAISAFVCGGMYRVALSRTLDKNDRDHFIAVSDLNETGRNLLRRAREAINTAINSDVYSDDLLNQAVDEKR